MCGVSAIGVDTKSDQAHSGAPSIEWILTDGATAGHYGVLHVMMTFVSFMMWLFARNAMKVEPLEVEHPVPIRKPHS